MDSGIYKDEWNKEIKQGTQEKAPETMEESGGAGKKLGDCYVGQTWTLWLS